MQIRLPLVLAHFSSFLALPAAPMTPACAGRRPLAGLQWSEEGSPNETRLDSMSHGGCRDTSRQPQRGRLAVEAGCCERRRRSHGSAIDDAVLEELSVFIHDDSEGDDCVEV